MRALRHPIHISFALLIAAAFFGSVLAQPGTAVSLSSPTVIFLTSDTSWVVPADWNSSNNSIEVIGGGGAGGAASGGGGGGAYSKAVNVSLTRGSSVAIKIGAGGPRFNNNGGDTYFCSSGVSCSSISDLSVVAGAKGGTGGSGTRVTPGSGGAASAGVGSIRYSGGNGGTGVFSGGAGGGGGGGGRGGGGMNGGAGASLQGGGGGGGAGGNLSTVGSMPSGNTGGIGGKGPTGTGGGAVGSNGTSGGGGGGGNGSRSNTGGSAGNGGAGTEWDASHGAGGGGGGGGGSSASFGIAGNPGDGGLYGGGGGGAGLNENSGSLGPAPGSQGIIVITYTTFVATAPTAPQNLSASGGIAQIALSWQAPASDGGSAIINYKIYRGTSPSPTTLYQTVGNVLSYTDSSVTVGTTYYYRIKATNAVGDSGYSNEANAIATASCPAGSNGGNITGWAWSETIGWISLNSGDTGTCAGSRTYGLTINSDNTVTGYAWSENIGWVKFGGLSSFPTGGGTTAADAVLSGGSITGWARACAGTSAGDCSTMTSRSDGWDGWIALSGTGYGITLSSSVFAGYAWGDTNVGWVDFSRAATTYQTCASTQGYYCSASTSMHRDAQCNVTTNQVCSYACSPDNGLCVAPPPPSGTLSRGSALKALPLLVHTGGTTSVMWGVQNATSCTVTGSNNDGTGSNSTGTWTGLSNTRTSSVIVTNTTYTLSCVGLSGGASKIVATVTVSSVPVWQEL